MKPSAVILCAIGLAAHAPGQIKRFTIVGNSQAKIGFVSARGGDVDGDGIGDFVVGTPYENVGFQTYGRVTVYSGATGSVLLSIPSAAVQQPWAAFGGAVAIDGDYDGDGYDDVLVGAPHEFNPNTGDEDNGCVRVYSGRTGALLFFLYGKSLDELGTSVDFVGDLDGDGADDFAVGAPNAGVAPGYVEILGKKGTIWTATDQSLGNGFGMCVRRAGDVDGDLVNDVVIGSPWFDRFSKGLQLTDCGRVVVVSGTNGSEIWEVSGWDGDWLGWSVDGIGDVDGDGLADVIAGAPNSFGSNGSVMVVSGRTSYQLWTDVGDGANDHFGWSVAGLRSDMSGDGVPDVVVGAPGFDPNDNTALAYGYVRTFSGNDGAPFHTYLPTNPIPGDWGYGESVSGGDMDGDGYADLVIGFMNYDANGSQTGLVEVWSGCPGCWINYGSGWTGTLGIPTLTASGSVCPGATVTLALGNSAGTNTLGVLFVGLNEADLDTHLGGALLVDPVVLTMLLSLPAAGATLSGTIPNDQGLLGASVFLQAIELDDGASQGVSFTQGLRLHVGFSYP